MQMMIDLMIMILLNDHDKGTGSNERIISTEMIKLFHQGMMLIWWL